MPGKGTPAVPSKNPNLPESHTQRATVLTTDLHANPASTAATGSPTTGGSGFTLRAATTPLFAHTPREPATFGFAGSSTRVSTGDRFARTSPENRAGQPGTVGYVPPVTQDFSDDSDELLAHTDSRRDPLQTEFSRDDEFNLGDEAEMSADGKYTATRSRSTRKTRTRTASAPPQTTTTTQTTATTSSRPTTTAGREAQKAAEIERENRTSEFYATQIANRCESMWNVMHRPPRAIVGHEAGTSEADSRYHNSVAEGLLETHIKRLETLDHEVGQYLVLWSNFENSMTQKKAAQAEAAKRAEFLSQKDGYEECKQYLLAHLTECETQLCYAKSTLQWLDSERSDDRQIPSNRASPTSELSRVPATVPTTEVEHPTGSVSLETHTTTAASTTAQVTTAPTTGATQILATPPMVTSHGPGPSHSNVSGAATASTSSSQVLAGSMLNSGLQSAHTAQKRVQVNPTPTAVYGTPVMTPSPQLSQAQQPGQPPAGMMEMMMLMMQQQSQQQAQAQQDRVLMQQAMMQQQAQQQQAQQQQAQMQQNILLQCMKQQESSQQLVAQTLSALIQTRNEALPTSSSHTTTDSTSHTISVHGAPERGNTSAPRPGDHEETEDGYDTFASYGGTGFGPPRGGFAGRGRGGTPSNTFSHTGAPPQPAAQQFKLPEPEPFKGELQDWPRFWEEWTHYISQTNPDNFSKTRLLKRLLQGPAKDITLCYKDTSTDYKGLVEALEERYHRPAIVKGFLIRKLRSIEAPARPTAAGIRQYYTQIQAVCRQLKDAGVNVDQDSIRTDIHDRMNHDMISEAAKQRRQAKLEEWTLDQLLAFIKEYMLTAEEIAVSHAAKRLPVESRNPSEPRRVNAVIDTTTDIFETEFMHPEISDTSDKSSGQSSDVPAAPVAATPTSQVVNNYYGGPSNGDWGKRSGPPQMGKRFTRPHTNKRFDKHSKGVRRPVLPCLFCDSIQHRSIACDKYKTHRTRRERLLSKPKPVCLQCLQPGHKAAQCTNKPRECYTQACKKARANKKTPDRKHHHPLLCPYEFTDPKDANQVHFAGREDGTKVESSDESESTVSHSENEREPYDYGSDPPTEWEDSEDEFHTNVAHQVETNMAIGSSNRTLMMTVKADVSHISDQSKRKPCVFFFDGGSSATLITKEQARELALPVLKRVNTTYHYFGGPPEGRKQVVWKVQFRVYCNDGTELVLDADAVDTLCAPLPSLPLKQGSIDKVLKDLETRPNGPVEVVMAPPQVLVGLDHLHLFKLDYRKELSNGFHLYDSRLGSILCGRGPTVAQTQAIDTPHTVNCVFGATNAVTNSNVPARTNAVSEIVTKSLELQAIERLASLEGIGIEAPGKVNEEELVLQQHKESLTRLPDGRYEVSFPFRDEILTLKRAGVPPRIILPSNFKPAVARLTSVWRSHLKDNPQGRQAYSNTFDVQLARNIIELVDDTLRSGELDRLVHYLAHHPVFRADKPTNLRVVFDGSARSGPGTRSLNDCLHPGPSLLESLIGILLRSRGAQILIIGDIEKAFLQISLREEDRDVTRFVWLKDPAKPPTPDNLVIYRYCRIPFGLNASPFLLLATIDNHLKQVNSAVSSEIRQNTYSDNVFLLAHTPEDGVQKYKETKLIFSDMKMNIREFISNSPQFNEAIPEEDRAKQTKEATLGHEWDSKRDVWTFRLPEPNPFKRDLEASVPTASNDELVNLTREEEHVMVSRKVKLAKALTKRVMLSILHGLWDPCGYFCPLTLQARLVHQELWAQEPKLKWDVPIPEAFIKPWEEATSSWSGCTFEIERHLFSDGKPASLQLHVFVDASGDGYGGVAYLRVTPTSGQTYTRLVYGKNRVKCRKPALTIPRKELLAALIGCRMVTFLRKEMLPELQRLHNIGDIPVYLWGDNQGVLYWIKDSAHVYTKFVQNRLSEIRSTADVSYRYVPTKDNPADVLSRGATTHELKSHTLWWHAAPWLTEDETQWPEQPSDFQPFSDEIVGSDGKVVVVHLVTRKEDRQVLTPLLEALITAIPKVVLTYSRMRRVLILVIRFAARLTAKRWKRNLRLPLLAPFNPTHTINVNEAYVSLLQYKASEQLLVWEAQQAFPPTPAQASQFNVETFEDGLLRCRGRLEKGKLSHDTVNPVWLPERTRVASYVIVGVHLAHTHAPAETTLALIRRRFWLVKGRRNIRQAISRYCAGCRLVKGPAFRIQDYAQLPLERISKSRPFAHIGLDLFGPFLIRMGTAKPADPSNAATKRRGRKAPRRISDEEPSDLKKVWGVIFTCMATRAVHLGVAHSLSAEHLMHALDRFMCCRGHPNSVTSDNAPSIILVNRALAEMWKDTQNDPCMKDYARENSVEWHFITPESPWQGGFYERLIRSVKHCIKATVGRRRLEISHFEQLLGRVAHTLNCRPLTYQTEGDVDAVALRPIDFLQPLAEDTTNMGPLPSDPSDPTYTHKLSSEERLVSLFAKQNALLESFWERWRGEYLLSLRERQHALKNANRLDRQPQVGEYVLVDDDEPIPRPFWKLARIQRLIPGRDGTIRSAVVRFRGGFESERSVTRLCPLELWPAAPEPEAEPEPSS